MLSVFVPNEPGNGVGWPKQALGRLVTSEVNAGTCVVGDEPLHDKSTRPRPLFWSALATRMNGGGPVKTPAFKRSWLVWSPFGSQLKPRRGEEYTRALAIHPLLIDSP